jgi:hypothetical protein
MTNPIPVRDQLRLVAKMHRIPPRVVPLLMDTTDPVGGDQATEMHTMCKAYNEDDEIRRYITLAAYLYNLRKWWHYWERFLLLPLLGTVLGLAVGLWEIWRHHT